MEKALDKELHPLIFTVALASWHRPTHICHAAWWARPGMAAAKASCGVGINLLMPCWWMRCSIFCLHLSMQSSNRTIVHSKYFCRFLSCIQSWCTFQKCPSQIRCREQSDQAGSRIINTHSWIERSPISLHGRPWQPNPIVHSRSPYLMTILNFHSFGFFRGLQFAAFAFFPVWFQHVCFLQHLLFMGFAFCRQTV